MSPSYITHRQQISCRVTIILLALFCLSGLPVQAAEDTAKFAGNDSCHLRGIEEFFNEAVPAGMAKYNIPGAVVSVVEDGETVFTKGYGYSDISGKNAVIPDETLFHIGSITKLFTWTAVMQLAGDGTIDLDENINTYLKDFSIPHTYPENPVTMRDLMTHSAGFEETEIHMSVDDTDDLYSFRTYCKDNIPAQVYPPGTVTSYSNYGTTLAAVVIEDVTGIPYEQYVTDNILIPLEMDSTVISYALSPESDVNASSGYHYTGGKNVAVPDTIFTIGPAGTISSTAPDMAKFISVHMNNGTRHGKEILSEETTALMHSPAFANDPRISSMCLGFYEARIDGMRIISHGGDTDTFHSLLAIIPDKKAGFFVSYNSPGGNQARNDLLMAFVKNYWPEEESAEENFSESLSVQKYPGTYQSTRHNYRTFEFYLSPPEQTKVIAGENNTIFMLRNGIAPVEYIAVAQGVFTPADGKESFTGDLVFHENVNGDVVFLCPENIPILAFERVDWYATTQFTDWIKNTGLIILLTVLIWPLMLICRQAYGTLDYKSVRDGKNTQISGKIANSFCSAMPAYARFTAGAASAIFIVFVLLILPAVTGDATPALYMEETTVPPALAAALTVPVIAAFLSVIAALFAIPAWISRYWNLWNRIHYTIIIAGLFMLIWWVNYWNLFVFRL